jgi:chromosome segregation ATPase
MARKIFSWTLIVLSAIFLFLSVVGIAGAWIYNEPLTRDLTGRLEEIDTELSLAQSTLASSRVELERALRIVEATEKALEKLTDQSTDAENILDGIRNTLDNKLLPELKTTRTRVNEARTALEGLQSILEGVSAFVPGVDLGVPEKILTDLIASTDSLDTEIANVQDAAQQASTFVSDTSYLLGGDLNDTKASLESFLTSIKEYEKKVTVWRTQVHDLNEGLPIWIDRTSLSLTFFLLWFGLSQFGLLLHGLSIRRGDDPLDVLRRNKDVQAM